MVRLIKKVLGRKAGGKLSSFVKGASKCLEIMPPRQTPDLPYKISIKSDAEAISGDWQAVGSDIWHAIRQAKKEKWARAG